MTDLTVLGGGAAGSRAAILAAKAGLSVTMIECGESGGGALHESYWPYRKLLSDAGSQAHDKVVKSAAKETKILSDLHEKTLSSLGVDVINGAGRIDGLKGRNYKIEVNGVRIETPRVLIATGSMPFIPDIPGIDTSISNGFVITPKEVLYSKLPRRVVVIGGNIRALQVAAWFAANRAAVILTLPGNSVAAELDSGVALWLRHNLRGIEYLEHSDITAINGQRVKLSTHAGRRSVECDKVVAGAKRAPAARGMGLGDIGIVIEDGAVVTDQRCRTHLPDVYAAGDVNMRTLSAYGAFAEAEVCVANILGKHETVAYRAIPRIFNCGAAGASVGETEESARAIGLKPICAEAKILGRAEEGFVKLVTDGGKRLIGAHLCGWGGEEIIWELAAMMDSDINISGLRPGSVIAETAVRAILNL
ncbi:MAG: FAD-dependent oxidoreductase [Oscillospiraceae bacterium]|nr:FAD-dependent oxidoreductase [Oscillospiraceae bacterium]